MELIGKGRQAEVYALNDTECVKLFYENTSIHDIEQESSIMEYISQLSIPVPKYLGQMEYNNRHGIKMERLVGETMLVKMLKNPDKLQSYAQKLGKIQSDYNKIQVPKLKDYVSSLNWSINKTDLLTQVEKDKLCHHLNSLPKGESLIHTDYHVDNIIVTQNDIYVIDWIGAAKANPLADVARTYLSFITSSYPIGASTEICNAIDTAKTIIKAIYLESYGIDEKELYPWLPVIAASRLMFAPQEEITDILKIVHDFLQRN